jgi:alanine racemase
MEKNWLLALAQAPAGTRICAVLKADAYGHGIANVVPVLMRHGVSHIGITSNPEAQAVRAAGFTGVLMRLRSTTREEAEDALPLRIEEQVSTLSSARFLMDLDARRPAPAALHLSLNAGAMSRDGLEISTAQGRAECQGILRLAGHRIAGICTHFPSNEAAELRASIARFHQDADWVLAQGVPRREEILLHGGSSFTLMSGIDPRVDMMRCAQCSTALPEPGAALPPPWR